MDKLNKQDLRRLCGDIKNCGGLAKLMTGGLFSKWIDMVSPSSIESLLDEIQEKDRALDLWSQKAQRVSDDLEQYRKDAERWRVAYERGINLDVVSEMHVDELIAMAKQGGANG